MYDKEFYKRNYKFQKALADNLAEWIAEKYKPKSIVDFGCGCGFFSGTIAKLTGGEAIGFNGDIPENKEIDIYQDDLSKNITGTELYDLVISLEVAEHIREDCADIFINNLINHGDRILFSAATPGQGGENHINEQPHEYWHKKFEDRGYKCFDIIRPLLKDKKEVPFWYRNNIFLYEKIN